MVSRRQFLLLGIAGVAGAAGGAAVAVSALTDGPGSDVGGAGGGAVEGPESRFAGLEAAEEPDGDLATVAWPAFVLAAGPEVQRLYEFQITNAASCATCPASVAAATPGTAATATATSAKCTPTAASSSIRWRPREGSASGSRVT